MHKMALLLMLGASSCSLMPAASLPLPAIPDALRVPAGQSLARTYLGRGTQNYLCQKDATSGAATWTFTAPEAKLFDARSVEVGLHSAGPTWQVPDGSAVVGAVQARQSSADTIPWLLLSARSIAGPGLLSKVTFIQRLSTTGGVAPSAGCDVGALGQVAKVPYTALYAFYEEGAPSSSAPARTND